MIKPSILKKEVRILAPCGILGYGYPLASFMEGIKRQPDAIVVDAGSTDGGPHKLGAGVAIVSALACKKDLEPMVIEGAKAHIPVLIGSAGGSGGRVHVEWTYQIVQQILQEQGLTHLKVAIIWADIPKDVIDQKMATGDVHPLGSNVKPLDRDTLQATTAVVAQMGHEPIVKALQMDVDIVICGRAYDPSPFAAVVAFFGLPLAYGYHCGKILECAALCAVPGTTKDCMFGIVRGDGFEISPLSEERKCTPLSVAAHTFYEKDHPYILHGPGGYLDLESCTFEAINDRDVLVKGSKYVVDNRYTIKLEGARAVCYRTFVVAGIRDPLMIQQLEEIEEQCKRQVQAYYQDISEQDYTIHFINYGINGVMGELESCSASSKEVGVIMEVLAPTQTWADAICATLRSSLLHYGYTGRKSTAGNLAFPFAPSDISFGPVYEFSVYHLMHVANGLDLFPIELRKPQE